MSWPSAATLVALTAAVLAANPYDAFCPADCDCPAPGRVDCSGRNLTAIPMSLSDMTTHLNLSCNQITSIPAFAFTTMHVLQEIQLSGNLLKELPADAFTGITHLQVLHLQENLLTSVPSQALRNLQFLQHLRLDGNNLKHVAADSFQGLQSLTQLWLNGTNLVEVPQRALSPLTAMRALTLASNSIAGIPDRAFAGMRHLSVLLLYHNQISQIGDRAFEGLDNLEILEFDKNHVTEVPASLSHLPRLRKLFMSDNRITYMPNSSFAENKDLAVLKIENNPISSFHKSTFANLPRLEELDVSNAGNQVEFPDLHGSGALQVVKVDRCSIASVPNDLCASLPKLKWLDLHSNQISTIPNLDRCTQLRNLNLANNNIGKLDGRPFHGLSLLRDLTLSNNLIQHIHNETFSGLTSLQYLNLEHNRIVDIEPNAFTDLKKMQELHVGENLFQELPTNGLDQLTKLNAYNMQQLVDFPPPDKLPNIRQLYLTYAYHCCDYVAYSKKKARDNTLNDVTEDIEWEQPVDYDSDNWTSFEHYPDGEYEPDYIHDLYPAYGNIRNSTDVENIVIPKHPIECQPKPGAFWPCDDLMGWWSLRCGVWIVFLLALLGNGTVLFVTLVSRSKIDVPKFLICNLAAADLLMGVYLGFLAIIDAITLGDFKRHAIRWQISPACQLAGFLGLLSSEVSVFTLAVITLERHYAITHALHLNKRLSLRHAAFTMICGWLFALMLASLPLFGISDYRKFAVCLPFETEDVFSLGYVCFLMLANGLAFIVILTCYTKMYCAIRGSQAWNSNDSRIAKRMALLVFTDFACWMPISFFSLTAAFGHAWISLNDAKVFTIFVLPLNSCANPFLYAIFTKHFKKDCSLFCKRLGDTTLGRNLSQLSIGNFSAIWRSPRNNSTLRAFFKKTHAQHAGLAATVAATAAVIQLQESGSDEQMQDENAMKLSEQQLEPTELGYDVTPPQETGDNMQCLPDIVENQTPAGDTNDPVECVASVSSHPRSPLANWSMLRSLLQRAKQPPAGRTCDDQYAHFPLLLYDHSPGAKKQQRFKSPTTSPSNAHDHGRLATMQSLRLNSLPSADVSMSLSSLAHRRNNSDDVKISDSLSPPNHARFSAKRWHSNDGAVDVNRPLNSLLGNAGRSDITPTRTLPNIRVTHLLNGANAASDMALTLSTDDDSASSANSIGRFANSEGQLTASRFGAHLNRATPNGNATGSNKIAFGQLLNINSCQSIPTLKVNPEIA